MTEISFYQKIITHKLESKSSESIFVNIPLFVYLVNITKLEPEKMDLDASDVLRLNKEVAAVGAETSPPFSYYSENPPLVVPNAVQAVPFHIHNYVSFPSVADSIQQSLVHDMDVCHTLPSQSNQYKSGL